MPIPSVHTDKVLFDRIALGDEAAFEQLFNIHSFMVSRIIYRIIRSEAVVPDLVQEVFLQLWLGRAKLAEVEDPVLWIYRITYNRSYMHIRRELSKQRTAAASQRQQDQPMHESTTEYMVDYRETAALIRQAIQDLAPQPRRIYEMNRTQGMKPQEIADTLGISIQGVRNSLTRSTKLIRDSLARKGIVVPVFLLLLPFSEICWFPVYKILSPATIM